MRRASPSADHLCGDNAPQPASSTRVILDLKKRRGYRPEHRDGSFACSYLFYIISLLSLKFPPLHSRPLSEDTSESAPSVRVRHRRIGSEPVAS
ncbi:hypothetical protein NEOLEDRAFT_120667 [Neolentinus lepideus HHB14362 ss-1]|uniref:Uncharacterized protein n=1 Tax=Neolentinus lepideus HHB14362 ss-1 TaxID=1314782 RepID=A0A165MT35_9AGAM|nr:hypothetical protein NEOLEDRAFT_120667 [Neolentinus lepideus HHB14362 ss-1]